MAAECTNFTSKLNNIQKSLPLHKIQWCYYKELSNWQKELDNLKMTLNLYLGLHVPWAGEIWKRMAPIQCLSDLTCCYIGHGAKAWSTVIWVLADCLVIPSAETMVRLVRHSLTAISQASICPPGDYPETVSHCLQGSEKVCPHSTSRCVYRL